MDDPPHSWPRGDHALRRRAPLIRRCNTTVQVKRRLEAMKRTLDATMQPLGEKTRHTLGMHRSD
jgi:hypothetical protein